MPAPLVTVITSTYNWPEALKQAMESVLTQKFENFEYIVIGDCCTDETQAVVKSYSDARIKWFNLPRNTGNQSGVNKVAMENACGKYIAYLNHDDLWFPDHLSMLLPIIEEEDLDIVNSACLEIPADGHMFRGIQGLPYINQNGDVCFSPVTTTVIHAREAGIRAGGWIDWRVSNGIPTLDFFQRLITLRKSYAVVPSCTALKFNSADRKNSYLSKDASEQKQWATHIRCNPRLRESEVMTALACAMLREEPPRLRMPKNTGKELFGWEIEVFRRIRGLDPMLDISTLGEAEFSLGKTSKIRLNKLGTPFIHCKAFGD